MSLRDVLKTQLAVPVSVDQEGVARLGDTRVTLETVIGAYEDGLNPEEIVQGYDCLQLADVYAVLSFYLRYGREVQEYLAQRQRAAHSVRHQNEQIFPAAGIRARLLARKNSRP